MEEYSLELPKGLSKVDLEASATPLRCWQEAMAAREEEGSCCRAQARRRELEAEERDMARRAIAINCNRGRPLEGVGVGGGEEEIRTREDLIFPKVGG